MTSQSVSVAEEKRDTIDLNESLNELKDKYESVFKTGNELKTMKGRPMRIDLVENVPIKPLHVNTPRRTPYAYQHAAKAKLDKFVALGVLEKVNGTSE